MRGRRRPAWRAGATPTTATATTTSRPSSRARSSRTSSGSSRPTSSRRTGFSPAGVTARVPLARQDTTASSASSTGRSAPKHKLMFAYHNDYYNLPEHRATPTPRPRAVLVNYGNNPTPNLTYTGVLSDKTYIEARYAGFYGHDLGKPNDGSNRVNRALHRPRHRARSRAASTPGTTARATRPASTPRSRTSPTTSWAAATTSSSACSTTQGGGDYTSGYNDYIYTSGAACPRYGYTQLPFKQNGQMKTIGVFFDDTYRVGDRLTLNLGVRYDHSKASLPDAPVLDAEGNPTSTDRARHRQPLHLERRCRHASASPGSSTRTGTSVLKGHYGRYYRGIITGEFDDAAASVSAALPLLGHLRWRRQPASTPSSSPTTRTSRSTPTSRTPTPTSSSRSSSSELTKDLAPVA